MTDLTRYDAARKALADAVAIDEVKDVADKAEALRVYARQAGDVEMEQNATELRLRAVRRFGQLEMELKAAGRMHAGGRPSKTGNSEEPVSKPITLADLGVDKRFSSNAQAIGGIAERAFEEMVARKRDELASRRSHIGRDIVKEQVDAQRKAAHAERTHKGGKVEDLHGLIADGHKFAAILADPPWHFLARSEKGEGRSASQHYTTDRSDEFEAIKSLPIKQLAADDCVLFMWMVDWCPARALEVIEAWGFAHKTTAFTWAKLTEGHDRVPRNDGAIGDGDFHFGQGYWTRANPEACWLATRGSPKRINADVRQLIIDPLFEEHSRKPDCVHKRIERLVGGPYLEVYARREQEGWITWGNELVFKAPLPDHDPETGELIEAEHADSSDLPDDRSAADAAAEHLHPPEEQSRSDAGPALTFIETQESPSTNSEPNSGADPQVEAPHAGTGSEMLAGCEGRSTGQGANALATSDVMDIPAFLRVGDDRCFRNPVKPV